MHWIASNDLTPSPAADPSPLPSILTRARAAPAPQPLDDESGDRGTREDRGMSRKREQALRRAPA